MQNPFVGMAAAGHVADYLYAALESGNVTHAYLIVGAKGCGSEQIAQRFAAALVSKGDSQEFQTALRGSHPDVVELKPASAVGYLVDQVRELVHDVSLAPVRATSKVYILNDADRMKDASANALLKTLEEPPSDVTIIMLSTSEQAVLQTLRSRCQVLTCDTMSSAVEANVQVDGIMASVAQGMGNQGVLQAAGQLLQLAGEGIDELKAQHEEEQSASADYLSSKARKDLAESHKREESMEQRNALLRVIEQMRSWLRDCMMVNQGSPELVSQPSRIHALNDVATGMSPASIVKALSATQECTEQLSYNVSPQLALEACLLEIREALCPR